MKLSPTLLSELEKDFDKAKAFLPLLLAEIRRLRKDLGPSLGTVKANETLKKFLGQK